ncbi:MAG: thiamine pyrophosphate-dependent enzyme [Gemmataceae bacterium]|nr:thiamine pyrophosphate-dependent enzyme [Gemmataceae bacterium]
MAMTQRQALEILAQHRGTHIVITTMGAVGIWPEFSDQPLDFAYMPSAMGHGASLGLGLALAQNRHGVVVVSGDGSLLMNLGCLATLAAHPADLYLVVLDNGLYEVTGGQPTPGAGRVDFAALARAAGIQRTYHFATAESWRAGAAEALSGPGPVLIWLSIEGRRGQKTPQPPRPMAEQIQRLRSALGLVPG